MIKEPYLFTSVLSFGTAPSRLRWDPAALAGLSLSQVFRLRSAP
jgi:hypothetical protein